MRDRTREAMSSREGPDASVATGFELVATSREVFDVPVIAGQDDCLSRKIRSLDHGSQNPRRACDRELDRLGGRDRCGRVIK